MSFIRVNEVGDDSLERVNKLLHNIPGGVYKAVFLSLIHILAFHLVATV